MRLPAEQHTMWPFSDIFIKGSTMQEEFCADRQGCCPVREAISSQYRAASKGFDWQDIQGVLLKVREETAELEEAVHSGDEGHAREELGDLLLACFSVARFLKADPVACLDHASRRFAERFNQVEKMALEEGYDLESCTAELLDVFWERAKKLTRQ